MRAPFAPKWVNVMDIVLIALLAIVAPYPVAGVVFGMLLGFAFYAAVVIAAINRFIPGRPVSKA